MRFLAAPGHAREDPEMLTGVCAETAGTFKTFSCMRTSDCADLHDVAHCRCIGTDGSERLSLEPFEFSALNMARGSLTIVAVVTAAVDSVGR